MDAYDGLLNLIRSGSFDVDTKVSELSLAETLGMSRTPVREALRVLDAQGLVESRGRGVRVRVPKQRELAEAFDTRCALEAHAAQAAAQAQRDGLLLPARLREARLLAVRCDEATRTEGPAAGAAANRAFHLAVSALAGNAQLQGFLEVIWDQITIATRAGLTLPPRIHDVHAEHEALLAAITAGDPAGARAAAEHHIGRTHDLTQSHDQDPEEQP